MKALAGALVCVLACTSVVAAADDQCAVASHLVQVDAPLTRVAQAIAKSRSVTIVVAGTMSSSLPGAEGARLAYPAKFELALRDKLPGIAVKVVTYAAPKRSAEQMAEGFPDMLKKDQPSLVIWQTGTFDAMSGVEPEQFQSALERAVDVLHDGGADLILVNMQYSPRTDSVLASQAYAEAIRWVALEAGVNLFDRQGIMRHWSELGTFDLLAVTKSLDTAAQVHNCIGRLLADLVADALKTGETAPTENK